VRGRGDLGQNEKPSRWGLVFTNKSWGGFDLGIGTYVRWGKLGLRGWEVGIDQCVRWGDLGQKVKTEPLGLGFLLNEIAGGLLMG